MSYLDGTQLTAGGQLITGQVNFDTDAANNLSGGGGHNAMPLSPGASLFITHALNEQWHVGFANYGDFGLGIDYSNDWAGRYYLQNGTLLGLTLMPSLSFKANEQWSFGLGLRALYGLSESELALDNNPLGIGTHPDGSLEYKADDWGFGVNLGVLYQATPATRVGLAYTSAIDLSFSDKLDPKGLSAVEQNLWNAGGLTNAKTTLDMQVPQTLTVSLFHQLDSAWALLASANWQDWSRFGEIGLDLDARNPTSTTLDANYRDSWHVSLGIQYQHSQKLRWNLGAAYDSSPVGDQYRTVTNPMGEAWRLGTGIDYALEQDLSLNLSYEFIWMGDMAVQQSKALPISDPKQVSGSYENAWMQAISSSLTWRY